MGHRMPIAALASVALLISLYLGLYQWGLIDAVWDPVFGSGSARVLRSSASDALFRLTGLPDAILGAWAYLTELVLAFAGSSRRWQTRPWLVLLFGLNVASLTAGSLVLVVAQATFVGSWCFLCLCTATLSFALAALAWREVAACVRYLHALWQKEHDAILVWRTLQGVPSDRAYAAALERAQAEGEAVG